MIIDFIELPYQQILAIDSTGCLFMWNYMQGKTDCLVRSNMFWQITQYLPISLSILNKNVIAITTSKQIIITTFKSIQIYKQQYQHRQNQYNIANINICLPKKNKLSKQSIAIKRINIQNYDDSITCCQIIGNKALYLELITMPFNQPSEMIDEEEQLGYYVLFYGTKAGIVHYCCIQIGYNISIHQLQSGSLTKILADCRQPNANQQFIQEEYNTNKKLSKHKITGLISFRDDSLLLIGTAKPQLYLYNLTSKKIQENLLKRITKNGSLQNMQKLQCQNNSIRHKFYTIHRNYFTEWNFKLLQCQGFYTHKNIRRVCTTVPLLHGQQSSYGQLLMAGYGSQVICHNILSQKQEIPATLETSLQIINQIKQMSNGNIGVAGSSGMIEIFVNGIKQNLLFTRKQ